MVDIADMDTEILVFYIIGVIICVVLNLLVIIVLASKKKDINQLDLCIISLATSDFLQAGIGYSVELYGFWNKEAIDDNTCQAAGFLITFLALVSISHLVGISLERWAILKFPLKARTWCANPKVAFYIIIPSWVYGLVWSVPPLFGWSSYRRGKSGDFACSVDLNTDENSAQSFLWVLLATCFVFPIIIIAASSVLILVEARHITNEVAALGISEVHAVSRRLDERKHAIMVVIIIIAYVISWTPYAACVFVLSTRGNVGDQLLNFSNIFAKVSTVYNPIIYSLFIKPFRDRAKRLFGFGSSTPSAQPNARVTATPAPRQPPPPSGKKQIAASPATTSAPRQTATTESPATTWNENTASQSPSGDIELSSVNRGFANAEPSSTNCTDTMSKYVVSNGPIEKAEDRSNSC